MMRFRLMCAWFVFLGTSNAHAFVPADIPKIIATFPSLKGFELVPKDAYDSEVEPKDRYPSIETELNGDRIDDLVLLLLHKEKKKVEAFLLLGKGKGKYQKPKKLYSSGLTDKGKVDVSLELKSEGTPGISDRMYFSAESENQESAYQREKAVEVSYEGYYCTKGFYFIKKKLREAIACD